MSWSVVVLLLAFSLLLSLSSLLLLLLLYLVVVDAVVVVVGWRSEEMINVLNEFLSFLSVHTRWNEKTSEMTRCSTASPTHSHVSQHALAANSCRYTIHKNLWSTIRDEAKRRKNGRVSCLWACSQIFSSDEMRKKRRKKKKEGKKRKQFFWEENFPR